MEVTHDFGERPETKPLRVRVECHSCKNLNRKARRHCKFCEQTGYLYIDVPRKSDGTIELTPENLLKAPVVGSAPRPRPGEEQ